MLQLKMKNGEIIPVIQPTAAYPSYSANQRSYLEIHIAEDEMTFDEFYALVTNSAATEKLILINDDKDTHTPMYMNTIQKPPKSQRKELQTLIFLQVLQ